MNTTQINRTIAAIATLDLGPIKTKLMHCASGEGWSAAHADAVEVEYRRFLTLMKLYPNEATAPLVDVDTFWHYQILDTAKYAADCAQAFGYFLHHYPYLGLDGAADEAHRDTAGARMQELYAATFGADMPVAEAAWCGRVEGEPAAQAAAWCGATVAQPAMAWCGATVARPATAWCGAATSGPAQQATAWCGATSAAPAKASLAWCGAATTAPQKQAIAWCGAATGKPLQQAVAWCGAATGKPAGATLAWCGAARPVRLQIDDAITLTVTQAA